MAGNRGSPYYDLEQRTLVFAGKTRAFIKRLQRTLGNVEDARQLIRASGSVGANYIEANESLSKKDFLMHLRISRKEAKESCYWLKLIDAEGQNDIEAQREALAQEATELTSIFSAIIIKAEGSP